MYIGLCFQIFHLSAQTTFTIGEQEICEPDTFAVSIHIQDFTDIVALQFGVLWDETVIELVSIASDTLKEIDWDFNVRDNQLFFLWLSDLHRGYTLEDNSILLSLTFKKLSSEVDSTVLRFADSSSALGGLVVIWESKEETRSEEAVLQDGMIIFKSPTSTSNLQDMIFKLWSNFPNPFDLETNIKFELSSPAKLQLSVYASSGKLCSQQTRHYGIGTQNWQIHAKDIGHSGVYYYHLQNSQYSQVGKFIIQH